MTGVDLNIPYIGAAYPNPRYGFRNQPPRQIVIHSVESPIQAGLGASLARNYFSTSACHNTSAHGIFDPTTGTEMVQTDCVAWHCGTGNDTSVGYEHTGRAAFTREEWMSTDGQKMLIRSAQATAKVAQAYGIPARWLSVAQVADNELGFCTHNDMRLARGGTSHTDPGPNFPFDFYMQQVKAAMNGGTAPTTTPPTEGDVLDMTPEELLAVVQKGSRAELKSALGNDYGQVSKRTAARVRDMKYGTHGIWNHFTSFSTWAQGVLNAVAAKVGARVPGSKK